MKLIIVAILLVLSFNTIKN